MQLDLHSLRQIIGVDKNFEYIGNIKLSSTINRIPYMML